jgi:outer membrane protein assembly factor BamE
MRFLFLFFLIALTGCQSNPVRHFDNNVKVGMEKFQVLEVMGTPWATTRLHGKDRWIYVIYDDGIRKEREVHFENGNAVFVGEYHPAPEKSAAVVDKQNEELNKKLDEEEVQRKKANQDAVSDYEKEVKGQGKKVIYMPDYDEVQ